MSALTKFSTRDMFASSCFPLGHRARDSNRGRQNSPTSARLENIPHGQLSADICRRKMREKPEFVSHAHDRHPSPVIAIDDGPNNPELLDQGPVVIGPFLLPAAVVL
jgi:hypothetical protein